MDLAVAIQEQAEVLDEPSLANVTRSRISEWETDERGVLHAFQLAALCNVFERPASWFMGQE